jgi:hypothetical protein
MSLALTFTMERRCILSTQELECIITFRLKFSLLFLLHFRLHIESFNLLSLLSIKLGFVHT